MQLDAHAANATVHERQVDHRHEGPDVTVGPAKRLNPDPSNVYSGHAHTTYLPVILPSTFLHFDDMGKHNTNPDPPGRSLDIIDSAQLSAETGISIRTLDNWAWLGKGPAYIKLGRHRRYRRADVERWIDENTHLTR